MTGSNEKRPGSSGPFYKSLLRNCRRRISFTVGLLTDGAGPDQGLLVHRAAAIVGKGAFLRFSDQGVVSAFLRGKAYLTGPPGSTSIVGEDISVGSCTHGASLGGCHRFELGET
jgi:hypothetical protein